MFLKQTLSDKLHQYNMYENDLLISFITSIVVLQQITPEQRGKLLDDMLNIPPKRKKKILQKPADSIVEFSTYLFKNWHRPMYKVKELTVRECCYNVCQQFHGQFLQGLSDEEIYDDFMNLFGFHHKNNLYVYFGFARAIDEMIIATNAKFPFSFSNVFIDKIEEIGLKDAFVRQVTDILEMQALQFLRLKGFEPHQSMFHKVLIDYVNDMEQFAEDAFREREKDLIKITNERNEFAEQIRLMTIELSDKDKLISELHDELATLRARVNTILKLKGKRVIVIGHPIYSDRYVEIIENYGGECRFFDGSNVVRIDNAAKESDLIIHVTAYGGHDIHHMIKKYDNVRHVNSKGLLEFQQLIESL